MVLILHCVLAGAKVAQCATPPVGLSQPFAGVTVSREIRESPPLREYWVQADLTNPAVHVRLCPAGTGHVESPWETTLAKVTTIAERERLDVAINGSFFSPKDAVSIFGRKLPYFDGNPARASGWTVTDGRLWSAQPVSIDFPSFLMMRDGRATIGFLHSAPRDAWQAVSGCASIVRDRRNVAPLGDDLAPRTAVGLDSAAKILTLFVVDGRRPKFSTGLSLRQLADELIRLGCSSAINLDSGGSTTMVIRHNESWPLVNTPSDGHDLLIPLSVERPVANALGIVVDTGKTQ